MLLFSVTFWNCCFTVWDRNVTWLYYNNRKKLQFIRLLTGIMLCFTHRKQQKW